MADIPLIVKPLRPKGGGWVQWPWHRPEGYERPYAIERWYNRGQEESDNRPAHSVMSMSDRAFWCLVQLAIILCAAAVFFGAIADLLKILGVK